MDEGEEWGYSGAFMSVARAISAFCALSALGCGTSYEPGVEVRVISAPSGLAPEEVLESVPAQRVRVFEFYWTSAELELLPCDSWARRAWDALVPNAHAHGISTPERLAVPTVERATHERPVELGVLHPAATRYCAARYRIGAADADAVGIDRAPAMAGRSIDVRGEVEAAPGAKAPFAITSARSFEIVRPIELDLSSREKRASLVIGHQKEQWFRGLAFGDADQDERERALIENFQGSITLHVE